MLILQRKRWTHLAMWKTALLLTFVVLSLATTVKADKVTDWNAIGAQAVLTAGTAGAIWTVDMAAMGFHYRSSCVRGAVLGKKVAKYVAKNYFQPVGY